MRKLRVRCQLPNASDLISGVRFERDDDGAMVSELVDAETATRFCSIRGYDLVEESDSPPPPPEPGPEPDPKPETDSETQPAKGKPGRKPKATPAAEENEE
jgi:hypothetical protein